MKKLICAMMFCGIFALPAQAAEGRFYMGGGNGLSNFALINCNTSLSQSRESRENATGFDGSRKCDDGDTSWKIFGGWKFNENLALESGYADFGATSDKESARWTFASGEPQTYDNETKINASSFYLTGVLFYPLSENWSVLGKLGGQRWSGERKNTTASPSKQDDGGTGLFYGVGVQYDIETFLLIFDFDLRVEWERFTMDDKKIGIDSADLITGSLITNF